MPILCGRAFDLWDADDASCTDLTPSAWMMSSLDLHTGKKNRRRSSLFKSAKKFDADDESKPANTKLRLSAFAGNPARVCPVAADTVAHRHPLCESQHHLDTRLTPLDKVFPRRAMRNI